MKSRLNVLFAVNGGGLVGGGEKVVRLLAEHFNKSLFNIFVCTLRGPLRSKVGQGWFEQKDFLYFDALDNPGRIVQAIARHEIDLVNIHRSGWTDPQELRPFIEGRAPIIVEHNIFGYADPSPDYRMVDHAIHLAKNTYWRHLGLIKNLPDAQERRRRASVIYPPVDVDKIQSRLEVNRANAQTLRASLGIAPSVFVIGRSGRPYEAKFDGILIDMVTHLVKKTKNFRFVAIGMPPKRKEEVKKRGLDSYFIHTPWPMSDERLYEHYASFDIHAHGARMGECCSAVIVEAMASGLPVITMSTPDRENGQIEQIDHGVTGIVANYPKAYAEAVYYLMTDPQERKAMGERARQRSMIYSAGRIAALYEKLFIELALAKGMEIGPNLRDHATSIAYYPNSEEVENFPHDYSRRLGLSYEKCWVTEKAYFYRKKFLEKFVPSLFNDAP